MKKIFFLFFVSIICYGLFAQTLEKIESEVSFVSEVTLSELEKSFISIVNLKTPLGIKTFRVMKNSSVIDSNSVFYTGFEVDNEEHTIDIVWNDDFYLLSVFLDGKNYSLTRLSDFQSSDMYMNIVDLKQKNIQNKYYGNDLEKQYLRIHKEMNNLLLENSINDTHIWIDESKLGSMVSKLSENIENKNLDKGCTTRDESKTYKNEVKVENNSYLSYDTNNNHYIYKKSLGYIGKSDVFVHLYNYNNEVSSYDMYYVKIEIAKIIKQFRGDIRFVFEVHDSNSGNYYINKSILPWDWFADSFLDSFSDIVDKNLESQDYDNNYHLLLIRSWGYWAPNNRIELGLADLGGHRAISTAWSGWTGRYQLPVHEISHNFRARHTPSFYSACKGHWTWTGDTMHENLEGGLLICDGHRYQSNIDLIHSNFNNKTVKDEIPSSRTINISTNGTYWIRGDMNNFLYFISLNIPTTRSKGRLFDGQRFNGYSEAEIPNVSADNISVHKIKANMGSGRYKIDTYSSNFDTMFYLLDHNGNLVAFDDDSGKGLYSKIEADLIGGQEYYFIVQPYSGNREALKRHPRQSYFYATINKEQNHYKSATNNSTLLKSQNGEIVYVADFGLNTDKNINQEVEINESKVVIYPDNRTQNLFHVDIKNKGEIDQILCYNTVGQLISIKTEKNNRNFTIDFSKQPSGIYIVKIKTTFGEYFTEKIIVK